MKRKTLLITLIVIGILALVAGAAYAQGGDNGNGRGGPPDDRGDGMNNQANCTNEPQLQAYNNGGMGFVNPQTGAGWNGQQRGQMQRGTGANGTGFYASMPPATTGELPQEVIDLMIEGWEDEQHAYAVYESVMEQFGDVAPFLNIQQAEAQHAAAWEFLFDRYDIPIPETTTHDVPAFESVQDACQVAADAEVANFGLYDEMLDTFEDYPDVYQVALSLRNASEYNHLPAFEACAGS